MDQANGVPLGKYGNNSPNPGQEAYRLLRWLWLWSSLEQVRKCQRVRHSGTVDVLADGLGRVVFRGFCTCKSVWACPVCAARIRAGRARELSASLVASVGEGRGLLFPTLTLPHDQGNDLRSVFSGVTKGWDSVVRNRAVAEWLGDFGTEWARSVEVTSGRNGFHPHLHGAMVTGRPPSRDEVKELRALMFAAWCRRVEGLGWRAPSEKYGVQLVNVVRESDAGRIGTYVQKVQGLAQEMTRMDRKSRGKTEGMFSVLRRAADGDESARAIWWAYENGTKGRRAVGFSRGWRGRVQVQESATDDQLLEADARALFLVGTLEGHQADAMVLADRGHELFAEFVGPGTPEAWRSAMEWLQGSCPWWATEAGWQALAVEVDRERGGESWSEARRLDAFMGEVF